MINPNDEIQPTLNAPTILILSVLNNENISLQAIRFPRSEHLRAFISRDNAGSLVGIDLGTVGADADGEVFATLSIPSEFQDTEELIIRQDSDSGYSASHEFRID